MKITLTNKEIFHSRNKPQFSLWGEIQTEYRICRGLRYVTTAGHGGYMVSKGLANKILPPEVVRQGHPWGSYLCFEEDCAWAFVDYFLVDSGLLDGILNRNTRYTKEEIKQLARETIERWYPEFTNNNPIYFCN